MKTKRAFILISMFITFTSCNSHKENFKKEIIGFWQTDSIYLNGIIVKGDLSEQNGLFWIIEFKKDSTYTLHNVNLKSEGKWTIKNNLIQTIDFRNDKMDWEFISENAVKTTWVKNNDTGIVYLKKVNELNIEKFEQGELKKNSNEIIEQKNESNSLIILGNIVNIREKPSTTAKVIFKLKQGDDCILLEKGKSENIGDKTDYWYKINFNGKIGWVFGAYTSLNTPPEVFENKVKFTAPH
jgi:hypothetical protein